MRHESGENGRRRKIRTDSPHLAFTGYLVGTMEKWNDAKKAEERDRVKHNLKRNGGDS